MSNQVRGVALGKLPQKEISEIAIRQEVDRILQSPTFAQSERLSRFLRFTVEHVLTGSTDSLKEYVIGTEVYDRKPPYHPSQDSIVRTEARRLRSKLKEYYELDGKDDPTFIFFRPGSYLPVFHAAGSASDSEAVTELPKEELLVEGAGVQVAVIPFLDLSGRPLATRYALGITDELVHALMHCEGCRVVSVNSTAHLGVEASNIPGLAVKLGVQIVFEGTVREEGNRIRVTGRIVDSNGFQLWSQRLDAETDPAKEFEIQEQFASALVTRVKPQISPLLTEKASVGRLVLSVYPNLLKAESFVEEGLLPQIQAALTSFLEVAKAAPGYARAFCGIARCHAWMALHGSDRSDENTSRARSAAETALNLDSEMADALTAMGTVQALEWRWDEAEASLRKSVEQRSHAAGNRGLALLLTLHGRFDEACVYLDRAQRMDPFSSLQKAARARFFYLSRRFEDALEHLSEPLRHGPIPLQAKLDIALIYTQTGNVEMARGLAQEALRCTGADLPTLAVVAEIYAKNQDLDLAESIIKTHSLFAENAGLSLYRRARLAAALGRSETAVALLAAAYRDKEAELPYSAVEPAFDSIRQIAEFAELQAKIWRQNVTPEHPILTVR